MPGSATDFLENKLLDHSLGTTTFNRPTPIYVGLFTVSPSDNGTGGTEVTGGSPAYARKVITFGAASNGSASNNIAITWDGMPACTVNAVGIFTSLTATTNDLIFYSTLSPGRTLLAGDTIRINSGSLTVSLE